MSKPEWEEVSPGVFWCKGCGCLKLKWADSKPARYKVPRRETERRKAKKAYDSDPTCPHCKQLPVDGFCACIDPCV